MEAFIHQEKNQQKWQIRASFFPWRVTCLVFTSTPQGIYICQHSSNLIQKWLHLRVCKWHLNNNDFKSYEFPSSDSRCSPSCRMTWRLVKARTRLPGAAIPTSSHPARWGKNQVSQTMVLAGQPPSNAQAAKFKTSTRQIHLDRKAQGQRWIYCFPFISDKVIPPSRFPENVKQL